MTVIFLQVSGPDHPNLPQDLMHPLEARGVRLLDVGQCVIHGRLSLGMFLGVIDPDAAADVIARVQSVADDLKLQASCRVVPDEEYEQWVSKQAEPAHLVTVLSFESTPEQIGRIARITRSYGLNIAGINRLSERPALSATADASPYSCFEIALRGVPDDPDALRHDLYIAAQELQCDIAFQVDDVYRRTRRLIAFDMDSTLIQTEVINELAHAYGVEDQVAAITEAAMNGELDFDASLRARLGLLKGLSTDVLEGIAARLPLSPGAERLISTVRALGYKTAILSGGFTYFGQHLKRKLGLDYVFANELEIEDGALTGNVLGPIVNGERKAQLLTELAAREGLRMDQVIAVGDGANDLPMLSIAGLGIAYHAKPKVKASARQRLCNVGLDGILYLLGVRDADTRAANAAARP